jgi:hypothetical protein
LGLFVFGGRVKTVIIGSTWFQQDSVTAYFLAPLPKIEKQMSKKKSKKSGKASTKFLNLNF